MEEACGVFGCISRSINVADTIAVGLTGLQHRGQESAGIVMSSGTDDSYVEHKGMGLVEHVFKDNLLKLQGHIGLGHTRYSTVGVSSIINCQPFVVQSSLGKIAVAHNGELVEAKKLRKEVLDMGTGLTTNSDSEVITQILCHPPKVLNDGHEWLDRIKEFMSRSLISYSLVIMHDNKLYAARDPFGNRPLCIGKIKQRNVLKGEGDEKKEEVIGWVVSSETCPFKSVGAELERFVKPGEIVEISLTGYKILHTAQRPENKRPAFCIFEYVYFSRPDSFLEGQLVHFVRERCGETLAVEHPVVGIDDEKDDWVVSTVPESATPAAIGYAKKLKVQYAEVLCKNRYVGRSFIQPTLNLRQRTVSMKYGVLEDHVKNKKIVLVDDSIVRGTTITPIVQLLRKSGALEVHIRVASPPIKYPCYMGINIPTTNELIANKCSADELAKHIGADSVKYISLKGLEDSVRPEKRQDYDGGYCTACLSNVYPVEIEDLV
ncbi:hypothetical protein HELRODRAFT_109477 [Helobdella robusta]|uniref:Amidophosphoribosyltransferase n=1 Tax=Helobdella robusta TaxID=6412 RepID=T1EEU1_HELRO|nr:hypothetical protein HELRODRAFT_109477 [Helobdella robusta]ESO10153.1 hypothetical protein HELRODRAFT_109477 [Helobdella robusta]